MLDTLFPLAFVPAAVVPTHLSEPMSHIVEVVSFVDVSGLPGKHTITAFLVVRILAFIFVSVSSTSFPDSVSMSQPILEVSLEEAPIDPVILAIA